MPYVGLSRKWLFAGIGLAVLAALVMAGCGSSCCCCSDTGSAATCLSNAKNLGLAVLMYVQDYDEAFPRGGAVWADEVFPYIRSEHVLQCPTVAAKNSNQYGYAFNSALGGAHLAAISPANTVVIYDSTTLTRGATDAVTTLPKPGRHSGVNSVVYADGYGISIAP